MVLSVIEAYDLLVNKKYLFGGGVVVRWLVASVHVAVGACVYP